MIILDTHLWIWLADENEHLPEHHRAIIEQARPGGLGVSLIHAPHARGKHSPVGLRYACPERSRRANPTYGACLPSFLRTQESSVLLLVNTKKDKTLDP